MSSVNSIPDPKEGRSYDTNFSKEAFLFPNETQARLENLASPLTSLVCAFFSSLRYTGFNPQGSLSVPPIGSKLCPLSLWPCKPEGLGDGDQGRALGAGKAAWPPPQTGLTSLPGAISLFPCSSAMHKKCADGFVP